MMADAKCSSACFVISLGYTATLSTVPEFKNSSAIPKAWISHGLQKGVDAEDFQSRDKIF